MFSSGVVKLTYLDKTWWELTALNWHYESQVKHLTRRNLSKITYLHKQENTQNSTLKFELLGYYLACVQTLVYTGVNIWASAAKSLFWPDVIISY